MKLSAAIDLYLADMWAVGSIRSPQTETAYRAALDHLADTAGNRDPRTIGRDDIKRALARWPNPNSRASRHSVYRAFFDWTLEEGIRDTNPARQVRRPRRQPVTVYRLTRAEAAAMLLAARPGLERRITHLGLCAGLRRGEMQHLRGRHVRRDGFVWVSGDIAKGGRERFVPVLADLELVVAEIRAHCGDDDHVLPRQRVLDPGFNTRYGSDPTRPLSHQSIGRIVARVARAAGIHQHIHTHLLRHAFADHIARHVGVHVAQALLGHADIGTTQGYLGAPTVDDLARATRGLRFVDLPATPGYPPAPVPANDQCPRQDSNLRSDRTGAHSQRRSDREGS